MCVANHGVLPFRIKTCPSEALLALDKISPTEGLMLSPARGRSSDIEDRGAAYLFFRSDVFVAISSTLISTPGIYLRLETSRRLRQRPSVYPRLIWPLLACEPSTYTLSHASNTLRNFNPITVAEKRSKSSPMEDPWKHTQVESHWPGTSVSHSFS